MIVGVIVMNVIFFAGAFRETDTIDRAAAGQLGDFVGGYVGTLFTLLSVAFLILTFTIQRRAFQLQSFEARYFELLKMHRENVAELGLEGTRGRKIFVFIIREFREILGVVSCITRARRLPLTQCELLHVAYNFLFFGVGPNSSRMLKKSLESFDEDFIDTLERVLNNEDNKSQFKTQRNLGYTPFEGHQSRLGHYYRHLYQCVRYVDQQEIEINKYEYVKTIRAQLSAWQKTRLSSRVPFFAAQASASGSCILTRLVAVDPRK